MAVFDTYVLGFFLLILSSQEIQKGTLQLLKSPGIEKIIRQDLDM